MKKTIKLNIILVFVMLIFYAITLIINFNNAKDDVLSNYWDAAYGMQYKIYQADSTYEPDNDSYDEWSCPEEFLVSNDSWMDYYPHRILIYDSDGREAARTGVRLEFFYYNENISSDVNYYCNLEEYLNDDLRKQLIECEKNHYNISEFACVAENNDNRNVIPVYIEYEDYQFNETKRITFTDKTPNVFVKSYNINFYNFDLDDSDYRHSSYEYIDRLISDGKPQKYFNFVNDNVGQIENEIYSCCNEIHIGSEVYSVLAVSYIEPNSFTLHDSEFLNSVKNINLLYSAVMAIVLAVLNFCLKRNKLNRAKYTFTNAAAHELKTPLAVIENKCEFILEGVDESRTLEYVNETYKEALKMNSLLNNILRYNKLSTQSRVEKSNNNLTQLVNNELEKYSSAAEVKNIKFASDLIDAQISCNAELISLAIGNFLSNAVKFSPSDSTVTINLSKAKNKYKLSVTNSFDGKLDNKIWDMLYMADESRNGKSTGMGLPISKEIFELHNYKYGLKNDNGMVEFYFIAK